MKTLFIAQFLIVLAILVASTENGSPSPQPAAYLPQYDYGFLPVEQIFPDAEAEQPQCQSAQPATFCGATFHGGRRPEAAALGGAKPPFPVPSYVPEALAPVGGAAHFPPFPFSVPAAAAAAASPAPSRAAASSSSFPFVVLPAPAAPAPGAAALFILSLPLLLLLLLMFRRRRSIEICWELSLEEGND